MKKFTRIHAVSLMLLAVGSLGADWYIAPSGSDGNPCTQGSPCRTAERGISRMSDGDTLWVADGVYTQGLVPGAGCAAGNTLIYVGPTQTCPQQGCAIRALNVTSPPSARFVGGSAGIVINRVEGWTVEGIETEAVVGIVQCDSSHTAYRDLRVVATGTQAVNLFLDGSDVAIERFETYRKDKPCEVSNVGSGHAFAIKNVNDISIKNSYIGYTFHMMTVQNVNGFTLSRSRLQHWAQHGIVLGHQSRNILIENNIMGGTSRPGCAESTMRGPRMIDAYEARNLTVRNNTIVGHGYSPRSAMISYFHFGNANAGCELSASEPGFCEFDTDVVCTVNDIPKLPGVRYSETSSQCPLRPGSAAWAPNQRCSGVCDLQNVKFYNNLIHDLRDTGQPEAGTRYVDWLSQGPWSETTNLTLDGNYYSGGVERWICTGSNGNKTTLGDWREAECEGGGQPDPNSVVGRCSGTPVQACGADGDCPGSQTCQNEPPAFVSYAGEDYRPAPGAPQVDAGVNGVDAQGVARCSAEDYTGAPRTDGACDIGAFEAGAVEDGSGLPDDEPPGQVQNIRRTDTQDD